VCLFVLVWEKSESFRNHAARVSGARLIVVKSTFNQHSLLKAAASIWKRSHAETGEDRNYERFALFDTS
jgi:hypothetical protein